MNEWKKLYEIENWEKKQIETTANQKNRRETIDFSKGVIHNQDVRDKIAHYFDKPVWREIETELPSFVEYDKKHYAAPTRKDLLHRYIEHLAGIVGKGVFVILYDTDKKEFVPVYSSTMLSSESRFISGKAAQRVINHANKELKELYGVKKNDN